MMVKTYGDSLLIGSDISIQQGAKMLAKSERECNLGVGGKMTTKAVLRLEVVL